MERNDNFGSTGAGQQGGTPSQAGSQGFGAGAASGTTDSYGASSTGGGTSGMSGGGTSGSTGSDAMPGDRQGGAAGVAHHLADKATDAASQGKEALTDRLGSVKEKAVDLKSTLADKLEAGAEALRNRAQSAGAPGGQQYAGLPGAAAGVLGSEKVQGYSNSLAGGLQGAADMLRDGDLQATLEKQVRENPARTLLIALGLGYVIGKAVRK